MKLEVFLQRFESQHPAIINGKDRISFHKLTEWVAPYWTCLKDFEEPYVVVQSENPLFIWFASLACLFSGKTMVPINPKFTNDETERMLNHLDGDFRRLDKLEVEPTGGKTSVQWQGDLSKPWIVIFTSGSSGHPKGVVHSFQTLQQAAQSSLEFYGFEEKNTWLQTLGMFHIGGFMTALRTFVGHGTWLLPQTNADTLLGGHQPDFISLVPTQLQELLSRGQAKSLRSCRAILLGGAPCPRWLFDMAIESKLNVSLTFGSSESGAQIFATLPGKPPDRINSVGEKLPHREVQITEQRLYFRGWGCFLGYLANGKFEPLKGWFASNDRMTNPTAGEFLSLGRLDTVFQCGAENISPEALVRNLEGFGHEASYSILPKKDKKYGEVPILVIRNRGSFPLKDFLDYIAQQISPLQRPREIWWDRKFLTKDKLSKESVHQLIAKQEFELLWKYQKDLS